MKISRIVTCHLVILSSCYLSTPTYANVITTDHLIEIVQIGGSNLLENTFSSYTTNSTYNNEFTPGVQAYGDLSTGKVGAISSATSGTEYQSSVLAYDTLSFSSAAEVSFNFSLHGFLSSSSSVNSPSGQGYVKIYDITDIDNWLESSSFFGYYDDINVVSEAVQISGNTVMIGHEKTSYYTDATGWEHVDNNLLRDGTFHEVSWDLSGSFIADPTKTYGITLGTSTYSSGGYNSGDSVADFSRTGTFEFTDLGGASFVSSSGAFLTAPSTVPLPPAVWLFGPGLIGLLIGSARRKKT